MSRRLFLIAMVALVGAIPTNARTDDKADVPALVKQLKLSRDVKVRVRALEELGKIGPDAKEASQALVEAMTERSAAVRQAAAEALEKVNPLLQKPVLAVLVDEEKRAAAIDELVGLEEEARPAIPMLLALYKAELTNPSGRSPGVGGPQTMASKVLTALTKIAPEDKAVLQAVLDAITYKPATGGTAKGGSALNPEVRLTAIELALDLKIDPKLLTKALVSATGDRFSRLRAIEALGELGPLAKDAVPALKKLKLDSEEKTRDAAAEALEKVEKEN